MTIVALIPAKGRSTGLPRKNLVKLDGKPLIAWSIDAAKDSESISHVYVSTDDPEISYESVCRGARVIDRPAALCLDDSSSDSVIEHAIPIIEKDLGCSDFVIVLLQPTSPLRDDKDIDAAIAQHKIDQPAATISVYHADKSILKSYVTDENGFLKGAFAQNAPYRPRQELPDVFRPNGAIYIFSANDFGLDNQIPRNKISGYVMSVDKSIDIDTSIDLEMAQKYLEDKK